MIQRRYLVTFSNLLKKSVASCVEFACTRVQPLDCDAHIAAIATDKTVEPFTLKVILGVRYLCAINGNAAPIVWLFRLGVIIECPDKLFMFLSITWDR